MDDAPIAMVQVRSDKISDRRIVVVVAPILIVALVLLMLLVANRYFDPDEIESMRASWQILQGRTIYRDFFEHHHPLFYLTLSVPLALLPERAQSLLWMRELNVGLIGVTLASTFWLGRRLFGVGAALVALVLLTTTHIAIQKMVELRPDNLQSALGLLGVVLLIRCFDRPRSWTAIASGAMFGLSFAALQKAAFLFVPVAAIVLVRLFQHRFRLRDTILASLGFVASLVPFIIWLAVTGSLHDFMVLNYRLNARQMYITGPAGIVGDNFRVIGVLADSASLNGTLWAFAAVAAIWAFRPRPGAAPDQIRLQREFCVIAAFLVLWVVFTNKFYWQYYLPAFPFIAVLAGGAAVAALRNHLLALASLLLVACVNPLWFLRDVVGGPRNNAWQLQAFEKAMTLTRPQDKVIDTLLRYNVYRPDPLFMGFINADHLVPLAYFRVTGHTENILDVIRSTQPVLVDTEALPAGAWPNDPRLAGYRLLPATPGMGDVLIRADRDPTPH